MRIWCATNGKWLLFLGALAGAIALFFLFVAPDWFYHPLGTQACIATYHTAAAIRDCKSYNWHSGIEGNLTLITLLFGVIAFWLKHNCYEHGCPWMGRVLGDDGHMRCKGDHKRRHPEYGVAPSARS